MLKCLVMILFAGSALLATVRNRSDDRLWDLPKMALFFHPRPRQKRASGASALRPAPSPADEFSKYVSAEFDYLYHADGHASSRKLLA